VLDGERWAVVQPPAPFWPSGYVLGLRRKWYDGSMWNLDIDLQRRNGLTAFHPNLDVVALDNHVLGDSRQDLLAQDCEQIGLSGRQPLVRKQNSKSLTRDHSGASGSEPAEDVHAALLPNNLSSRPLRSRGMVIGMASPLSRAAASR